MTLHNEDTVSLSTCAFSELKAKF